MKRKDLVNYVKNKKLFEYNLQNFQVFVKQAPENIDVEKTFKKVNLFIPQNIISIIDVVYIGDFSFLNDRNINAMYKDGGVYISNEQDNEKDLIDDFVHELAHAVEEEHGDFLYADEEIKNEYFGKLKKLKNYLAFEGYDIRNVNFFNTNYDKDFDSFLLNDIGYDKLRYFIDGLFLAPYSVTSLREYFARAFEEYFLGNVDYLRRVCPYVYKKLHNLIENMEQKKYEY